MVQAPSQRPPSPFRHRQALGPSSPGGENRSARLAGQLQARVSHHHVSLTPLAHAVTTHFLTVRVETATRRRGERACSSAGRALPLHGRCHGFDPCRAHHLSTYASFAPLPPPWRSKRLRSLVTTERKSYYALANQGLPTHAVSSAFHRPYRCKRHALPAELTALGASIANESPSLVRLLAHATGDPCYRAVS